MRPSASTTSSASPQISRLGSFAIWAARPPRIMGWSSTTNTRLTAASESLSAAGIGFSLSVLSNISALPVGQRTGNECALVFGGRNVQYASNQAGAIAHEPDADAVAGIELGRHADAVVGH